MQVTIKVANAAAALIDITAYAKLETVKVSSVLTSQIDTADFNLRFSGSEVDIDEKREVVIHKAGDVTTKYFGGYVTLLDGSTVGPEKVFKVSCQDYTSRLEETKVNRIYLASTDQAIIQSLFATYLPEIDTATYVGASLTHGQIAFGHDNTLRECMDTLSGMAGWDWYVDYDKKLHYFDPSAAGAASFSLSSSPDNLNSFGYYDFEYSQDGSKIANRVTVGGGSYRSDATTFYLGSDGLAELALPYPLHAPPGATAISVWRNDGTAAVPVWTSLTVGAGNVARLTDYDCLHYANPPKIEFARPPRPYVTNAIKVLASYEAPVLVTETSATSYALYGRYFDEYINDAAIDNIPLAIQRAQGVLLDRALAKESISLKMAHDGLSSGQLLTIVNATHGINSAYIVREVSLSLLGNGLVEYSVAAGEFNPDFLQLLIRLKRLERKPGSVEQAKMHELLSLAVETGVITDGGVALTNHAKGDYQWDGATPWAFATWGSPVERLSNGGFETAGGGGVDVFANWSESAGDGTIIQDAVQKHSDTYSGKLTAGPTINTYIYQSLALLAGVTYNESFWARGDGTYAGRYYVYDVTHAAYIIALTSTGVTAAAWSQITASFVVPAGCLSVYIGVMCPSTNAGIAWFDDVSVLDT